MASPASTYNGAWVSEWGTMLRDLLDASVQPAESGLGAPDDDTEPPPPAPGKLSW
jgi:hypothetical protein